MTTITVVVPARSAGGNLTAVLRSLDEQTLVRDRYEVIVVADGWLPEAAAELDRWHDGLLRRVVRQSPCGPASARNLGLFMAGSRLVLFLDDDEVASPSLVEQHIRAHATFSAVNAAVVGSSSWSAELPSSPLLHFLRGVERLPLGYPDAPHEDGPDFAHFRARQLSVKRGFLARHGAFEPSFAPLEDVELGYRLRRWGLDLHYWPAATSARTRCPSFQEWSAGSVAEGRAIAQLAFAHRSDTMQGHCRIESALLHWQRYRSTRVRLRERIARAEAVAGADVAAADPHLARDLWLAYRACFELDRAQGIADAVASGCPPPAGLNAVGAALRR